jgi:ArsR family transcriptional regulator
MLQYIDEHQPVCVNKINVDLNIDQSITSQHLRLLRMAELVEYTRDGKYINYSINPKRIAEVTQVAKELAGLFDQQD